MADLQVISKFAIIFSFIAFHAILTSEGRLIKSAWKDELRAINNDQMHEQASQFLTPSQSPTNDDHSDAGKETVSSPTARDQAADLGESEAVYKDDFRPTTPGSSPGVGHSFVGSKKGGVQLSAPSGDEERLTVTEVLGDFRPTGPGHSPGVGHVFESKYDEPKA
ncbi:uncharacterized protein LOC115682517 [Syzygium oleosum]|uniref:uncharacterized protein LOC115682517 n=1 Tax=Syzygium oleosum TaxID=219896 RepID=UPI0011D18878|nr:uncharacterized protein LOC115682517 [Syzygium oleosum]